MGVSAEGVEKSLSTLDIENYDFEKILAKKKDDRPPEIDGAKGDKTNLLTLQIIERSTSTLHYLEELGLRLEDGGRVRWKQDAAAHPRNWSTYRKCYDLGLIFLLDLFTTAVSTAGPSVAESAMLEYNLSRTILLVSFASTRWVFRIASAVTGLFSFLLIFIKESRPSRLLARRVALLKSRTGLAHLRMTNPDYTPNFQTFIKVALRRPVQLFFTDPIVTIVSVMSAIGWALIYLFTESLPQIYAEFGFSWSQSSLLFLLIGCGIIFGILPRIHDYRLLKRRSRLQLHLCPEDKLFGFSFAAPSLAFGLWWLTLTIPPASNLPWYASLVGLVAVGFATNEFVCTLSGYLADTYTVYACSAFAAMSFLRAVLGGIFPLIGTPIYTALGSNWATAVLACIATTFCFTVPLFQTYGKRIRQRSKFAKYSLAVNRDTQIYDDNME
ncbi:hypothetical protein B7463_g11325, partial [Scytalidium lignicola]